MVGSVYSIIPGIVPLTRSECLSAAGCRFVWVCFLLDFCGSLQSGRVYRFPESAALNTCVSQMRLIKFDELKNVFISPLCRPVGIYPEPDALLRTPSGEEDKQPPPRPPPTRLTVRRHTPRALDNCGDSQKSYREVQLHPSAGATTSEVRSDDGLFLLRAS